MRPGPAQRLILVTGYYDPSLPDGPTACPNCGTTPEDMQAPRKLAEAESVIATYRQALRDTLRHNNELRRRVEPLDELARWLTAMDDPADEQGQEDRRTATLQKIVDRAQAALAVGSKSLVAWSQIRDKHVGREG